MVVVVAGEDCRECDFVLVGIQVFRKAVDVVTCD